MKKRIIPILFTILLPIFAFSQAPAPIDTTTIDYKINQGFGSATGWFVSAIFYQIPIGTVEEDIIIDFADFDGNETVKNNNYQVTATNDSLTISALKMGNRVASVLSLTTANPSVRMDGNSFVIAKKDAVGRIPLKGTTPFTSIFWVLFPLILGALYFTFYFKFINFTGFRTSFNIIRGKYDDLETDHRVDVQPSAFTGETDNPDTIRVEGIDHGEVTHFQALTAALSATVGLGNIAGVAVAVSIGGAGATFWMIVAGFLGMASKFVECTLGVKYRDIGPDGTVYGGPMYYLKKGLASKGMSGLGKVLAVIFAIMCIGGSFGGGNMFQINQAVQLFESMTGGEQSFIAGYKWAFGLVMAILVGIVIIGGIKSIAQVTDKIVPFMVAIYVLASLFVLIMKFDMIPDAFAQIFNGAFTGAGVAGGAIGVLVQGFRRAAFSNEAGIGSASIAHAAVKTNHAASEGMVALLEPFIDTVLVCTMTALVLVITGNVNPANAGLDDAQAILLTSGAFGSVISWFPWVLTIAVVLFAFSTMISWSYYGYQAWSFLFGRSKTQEYLYKFIFCCFVVIGASLSLGAVIGFSDAMIFAMMVPNMVGLVILAPKVKEELNKYMAAIKNIK